jgi:hypothetical protein
MQMVVQHHLAVLIPSIVNLFHRCLARPRCHFLLNILISNMRKDSMLLPWVLVYLVHLPFRRFDQMAIILTPRYPLLCKSHP